MIAPDKTLELKVLSYLLKSGNLTVNLSKVEAKDFYFPETALLLNFAKYHFKKYTTALPFEVLKRYLDKYDRADLAVKTECLLAYQQAYQLDVDEKDYLYCIDEMKEITLHKDMTKTLESAANLLVDGDATQAFKKLQEDMAGLKRSATGVEIRKRAVWEATEERKQAYIDMRDHPERFQGVPFGLKRLDELTNGMQQGEMGIVFARTGAGKTRFLFTYAYNAVQAGYDVMYFSLEMSLEQLERVYDSRAGMIPYSDIKMSKLGAPGEAEYFQLLDKIKDKRDKLYIVDIPRGCTVNAIEAEIDEYEKIYHKRPDLVIVDYLSLMQSTRKYSNTPEKMGMLTQELRELGRAKRFATFSATQANRDILEATSPGTEHVAWSDSVAPHCDLVLNIPKQSEEEKMQNLLKLIVVKYRDGANVEIETYVDWTRNYISNFEAQVVEVPKTEGPTVPTMEI